LKRFSLITSFILSITLTIILAILIILSVINTSKYSINDSMVFIESVGIDYTNNGMGFVYKVDDKNNYIITNYHVVEDNNDIYVYNKNNKKEKATLLYFDKYTDIAILKISNKLNLKPIKINYDKVKLNDEVYYFNINEKVIDKGNIVALDKEVNLESSFYKANVIDGNIYNGNSGGPVLNNNNEVIGMLSLKEEDSNKGLYIPIENVMNIVTKLENQMLIRPNLGGIFVDTSNIEVLNNYGFSQTDILGVVIVEVNDGYPLMVNGLLKGDIITRVNGVIIESVSELQKEIYSHNIGDTITLEYYRNNNLYSKNIYLDK